MILEYSREGCSIKPERVFNILISTQTEPNVSHEDIESAIKEKVIEKVVP